ncbi:MAG: hypothetical protein HeimC3_36350 [Candidatus Heimdallarchaeota archaeon LC_3]|nr:MAG: hypothetical protein HeimC3_36350 [Candidatus Heimdallarchaeota archaeon LC_3]
MAKNNKIIVMIATLLFAAVGLIISNLIQDIITDQASSQNEGIIKEFFDLITTPGLLSGLIWLLLCIIVFYGVRMVVDEGENVGPISLFFLLIWLGAVIGLVIGEIVWILFKGSSIILDLDLLIDTFAFNLTLALGPSFAAALGVTTKNR